MLSTGDCDVKSMSIFLHFRKLTQAVSGALWVLTQTFSHEPKEIPVLKTKKKTGRKNRNDNDVNQVMQSSIRSRAAKEIIEVEEEEGEVRLE